MSNYSEITLVSDDEYSLLHSPNNTTSHFRTYFDHELTFDTESELALKKITFYNYFHNITNSNNTVYVQKFPEFVLRDGQRMYVQPTGDEYLESKMVSPQLQKFYLPVCKVNAVNEIFDLIDETGKDTISWWGGAGEHDLRGTGYPGTPDKLIYHDTRSGVKVKYIINPRIRLYVHREILEMLGFANLIHTQRDYRSIRHEQVPSTHMLLPDNDLFEHGADMKYDLRRLSPILRVTSDIVYPTRVYGHKMLPLLIEKSTSSLNDGICEYSPIHLSWLPLRVTSFSSIELYIRDHEDRLASFAYSPVVVELVIRDKQTTHSQF